MKTICLTQGKEAIVDDCDYEELSTFRWFAHKTPTSHTWYAKRNITADCGKQTTISMHNVIMGQAKGRPMIDHRDGNGLNNRRSNLRHSTCAENQHNQTRVRPHSSKFKGVGWVKRTERWSCRIQLHGKRIHLGNFSTETDAAAAYDLAAVRLFGDFSHTNLK